MPKHKVNALRVVRADGFRDDFVDAEAVCDEDTGYLWVTYPEDPDFPFSDDEWEYYQAVYTPGSWVNTVQVLK